AEPPDWVSVAKEAQALLSRSKDIRVAILLTRALTRIEDIAGLDAGLTMIHALLERYWDHVHPQLDAEDGDATVRLNALAALSDPEGLLRDVRAMFLVRSGPVKIPVREILAALGKLPASGKAPTQQQLEGMLAAAAKDGFVPVEAARSALDAGNRLFKLLIDRVGSDRAPNMRPLLDVLTAIAQLCDNAVPRIVLVEIPAGGIGAAKELAGMTNVQVSNGEIQGGGVHSGLITGGEIRSRDDALRMLDRVCEFMERTEPAHPAPLLIRRAQRLLTKNFVEIIQELAPESMKAIQQLAGLEKK
ncbi:MAG: type VI secretion system protein TssA, partial [Burkholderiales bacterium]|nr:type VI secretion system protein TssA [Burkholderiales bacterium]